MELTTPPDQLSILGFALWIVPLIIHVGFAVAVYSDAKRLWKHLRRKTVFVGGDLWALATLFGGVTVAALYWLIHHSTLRPQSISETETGTTESKPEAAAQKGL